MRRRLLLVAVVVFVMVAVQLCGRADGHNITRILGQHPSLSSFNHYLSLTHLAEEINRRQTITVCALDNAAMADITSKGYSIYTIRDILALHATGMAPGNSGYVNITDLHGGKIGFTTAENSGDFNSFFVKSVVEKPYNISVLQISAALSSPEADAPTPAPTSLNLASVLASKGCKAFSALLTATKAAKSYQDSIEAGLTVFCASDAVVHAFMPKYNKLSPAHKLAVLLYHAVPEYNSMGMLQTSNAAVINSLATASAGKYDFTVQTDGNVVTLETEVVGGKITGTLIDEEPLAMYKVDRMLLPKELFKAEKAESPESSEEEDDGSVADQKDGSLRINGYGWATLVASVICGVIFL
ncbi:hypothetical protein V2J09_009359 [Rumex salicifolius]